MHAYPLSVDQTYPTKKNRFTEGKGWLQGTQVFLQIGPRDSSGRNSSGGTTTTSGLGSTAATGAVAPSSGTPKSADNNDDTAQVLITVRMRDHWQKGRGKGAGLFRHLTWV